MKSSAADTSRGRKTDVSTASTPPPKRRRTGNGREKRTETGKEIVGVKEVLSSSMYKFEFLLLLYKYFKMYIISFFVVRPKCNSFLCLRQNSLKTVLTFSCLIDDRGNSHSRSERSDRSGGSMREGWSARLSRGIRRDEPLTPQHHPKGQFV